MHKAKPKLPKLLISAITGISLVFGGLFTFITPASAVSSTVCGTSGTPVVDLITDPIFYSGIGDNYDANYIGYSVRSDTTAYSGLAIKLSSFAGGRVSLVSSQAVSQEIGSAANSQSVSRFFLAKVTGTATASQTHTVELLDGQTSICSQTTALNSSAVSPAGTSNNSNKVDSVVIGNPPTAIGGTITVTVKGETGQVGTNEGISFAPVSNSSFPADKWTLQSAVVKLNQTSTWTDDVSTKTFTNRLYLPYTDASYGAGVNLGAIDGKYTATYTFELIAATGAATSMKPIQYVGNVYTGSMPGGSAPTITASGAAAVAPTISPASQSVSGTTGTAITATSAFTPSNFSAGTIAYTVSPALPAGLNLAGSTGVITGTPSAVSASATYTVTATNGSAPGETATSSVVISVVAPGTPAITPGAQSVSGTTGTAITATTAFSMANFTCTPVFSASLPAGLSINSGTGVISGTPTATSSSTVTVTAACNSDSATASVSFSIVAPTAPVAAAAEVSRKVTICHRTHSVTNPYVRITVDYNSVNKKSGHQGHDEIFAGEHVFKAGIYKRAKDKDWGDIIPADPTGLNRWQPLNWTTLGAQIYNGTVDGCPAFDAVKYYNALREAGVPEKKIKQEIGEIEAEQAEAEPTVKKSNVTEIKYTGSNKQLAEEDGDKVTLCHRTNSVTNPYVRITVAASSVYKNAGHYGHDEIYDGNHVFDSTVNYPNNRKDWGDIIPADPTGKNRWAALNMTTLGKKIYNGEVEGCAEKPLQTLYNELREEGQTKKQVVTELEKTKNTEFDAKELDEIKYTGTDPVTEKSEPKEPVTPAAVKIPDQSLSGIVWLDINKDGLKDPNEPLMKNIKLYVVQVSSIPVPTTPANMQTNGTVRRADLGVRAAAVVSVDTDENGFYLFPSLGAGDWMVTTTVPEDLYVTYDSHESADGSITTTVPVASHAFTWVGLVADTEQQTLQQLKDILTENPFALPLKEVPAELQELVKQARVAVAAGKDPVAVIKAIEAGKPTSSVGAALVPGKNALAETGSNNLTWLFFGILLLLSGVALRFARTKQ